MSRLQLDQELERLEADIIGLGHLVNTGLEQSIEALENRNMILSEQVIANDRLVNNRRHDIEMQCLGVIARYNPKATDLRHLTAVIAIASELERINDYAKGIAKISLLIGEAPIRRTMDPLPRMCNRVQNMLERAMHCYNRRDVEQAKLIAAEDAEVDAIYNEIYRDIFQRISEDSSYLAQGNYLVWVAHNLERAADRVVNICERTIFVATGLLAELDDDQTVLFPISEQFIAPD